MKKIHSIIAAIMVMVLTACTDKQQDSARQILAEAEQQYSVGDYEGTLRMIDSLRRSCPKALEERKKALVLFQDVSEKLAQKQIAETDEALQKISKEIETLQPTLDEHRKNGTATAEELSRITLLKTRRDSLQIRFDTQCATVRLIREKRKAN